MSTTSQATACARVANESPEPQIASGRPVKHVAELEHRRQHVEGRLAGRKAERGDVHVAVHEAAAGDERSRGQALAAGGAEIHDEGRRGAGVAKCGEAAQQCDRRIDLADAGVEDIDPVALETAWRPRPAAP